MSHLPTNDPQFLRTLNMWIEAEGEILMLFRYAYAGGSRSFEFYRSFEILTERLSQLAAQTSVIAFKPRQRPIRGTIDDEFIARTVNHVPDGAEYLVLELVKRVYGKASWFPHRAGESHAELRAHLEDCRGLMVSAGLYPPWLYDTDEVISAIAPDANGAVRDGAY